MKLVIGEFAVVVLLKLDPVLGYFADRVLVAPKWWDRCPLQSSLKFYDFGTTEAVHPLP